MSIKLFRGDDSDFADLRDITIVIDTGLDLTGYSAKFSLQGYRTTIDDISSGTFTISFSSDDTRRLMEGFSYGALVLIDAEGRRKTISNKIPFEILNIAANPHVDTDDSIVFEVTIDNADVNLTFQMITRGTLGTDTYSVTNFSELKTLNLADCTMSELCDLVGTLIQSLQNQGVVL